MIIKNHLYTAHWQVKLKLVSTTFPSDNGQNRYNAYALDQTLSCMKPLTCFLLSVVCIILKYLFIWLHWVSVVAFISLLQLVGSLAVACKLLVVACEIQFPDQRSNPGLLYWQHRVLATELPGNLFIFEPTSHYQKQIGGWLNK